MMSRILKGTLTFQIKFLEQPTLRNFFFLTAIYIYNIGISHTMLGNELLGRGLLIIHLKMAPHEPDKVI